VLQRRDGNHSLEAALLRVALIVPWLLLCLTGPSVAAEPKLTASTPPAGKFYVVQADGKSRQQDPVREGVAVSPDKRLSGAGQADRKTTGTAGPRARNGTGGQVSNASTSRMAGTSAPPKPARDEFAAFRCERFGFYYTKAGRCVVPATRIPATPVRPRPPAGSPAQPLRP
jgi:hypothetical protein